MTSYEGKSAAVLTGRDFFEAERVQRVYDRVQEEIARNSGDILWPAAIRTRIGTLIGAVEFMITDDQISENDAVLLKTKLNNFSEEVIDPLFETHSIKYKDILEEEREATDEVIAAVSDKLQVIGDEIASAVKRYESIK